MELSLTSSAFSDGAAIPREHTCDGDDVSPPLEWTGVPSGTESFALIVDDPDVPDPAPRYSDRLGGMNTACQRHPEAAGEGSMFPVWHPVPSVMPALIQRFFAPLRMTLRDSLRSG